MSASGALILLGHGGSHARWPLHDTPPALAPMANEPTLTHQVKELTVAGVTDVAILGDDRLRVPAALALETTDRALGAFTYVSLEDAMGVNPFEVVPQRRRAPLVVLDAATLLRRHIGPAIERVEADPQLAVAIPAAVARPANGMIPLRGNGSVGAVVLGTEVQAIAATLPVEPECDVSMLVRRLRTAGVNIALDAAGDPCQRIRDVDDLLSAHQTILDELDLPKRSGDGVEGRVLVGEGATLDYAVVRGPAVIGPGAFLADCYVGPYSSIGANAVVEEVELERCIVCADAVVRQLGMRIEESLVGPSASVSQNLRPPRALRLAVGDDAAISLA